MTYNHCLIVLLLLQSSPRFLSSVNILPSSQKTGYVWSGMVFNKLDQDTIKIRLGLGETLETQTIRLAAKNHSSAEFKIEIRYETSFTVSDGSKTLAFRNWKHFLSDWRELSAKSRLTFVVPKYTRDESSIFPQVSNEEIFDELMKEGGTRWVDFIKKEKQSVGYPFRASISKYYVRISAQVDGRWETETILEFTMPMGC